MVTTAPEPPPTISTPSSNNGLTPGESLVDPSTWQKSAKLLPVPCKCAWLKLPSARAALGSHYTR